MANKPKAYVASPYGFAEGTKYWYDKVFLPLVSKYIEPIDPWKFDVKPILEADENDKPGLWMDFGDNFYEIIKSEAKLLIAILDQEPPDIGTVCEVVWASANGIPVIGYRNDVRTSGEKGNPYNLMLMAAIRKNNGVAVSNLNQLETELKKLVYLIKK